MCIPICCFGALIAKMDIEQAYRNIPVAPKTPEPRMTVTKICGQSSLIWALVCTTYFLRRGRCSLVDNDAEGRLLGDSLQYVDDFLTIGVLNLNKCQQNMAVMCNTCKQAGLPLEPFRKTIGQTYLPGDRAGLYYGCGDSATRR